MTQAGRSRATRKLAEAALVRLVLAYGGAPEFVLLGGLVPDLLCSTARRAHIGTTDIDIQVDLEIAAGSENAPRIEKALKAARFSPDQFDIWTWLEASSPQLVVKVEFLADLDHAASEHPIKFAGCEQLGALNLRGTGFASRSWELKSITAMVDGHEETVRVRVATVPGYLLAKVHAAHGRGYQKDWYDIVYVLLHNDLGGPADAARAVLNQFAGSLVGRTDTALRELEANFNTAYAQGARAYVSITRELHPEEDGDQLSNDAIAAVAEFLGVLGQSHN